MCFQIFIQPYAEFWEPLIKVLIILVFAYWFRRLKINEHYLFLCRYLVIPEVKHNDDSSSTLTSSTTKPINTENSCEDHVNPQKSDLEMCFLEKARLLALSKNPNEQQQNQQFDGEADIGSVSITGRSHNESDIENTVKLGLKQMSLNKQLCPESEGLAKNIHTVTGNNFWMMFMFLIILPVFQFSVISSGDCCQAYTEI